MDNRYDRWLSELEPYRATNHGKNPWTDKALANVLMLRQCFDDVRDYLEGRFTSVYRCARINKIVGGVPTSRHLYGLACDISPGESFSPPVAARIVFDNAKYGQFGMIKNVIMEAAWVHISWWAFDEKDKGMTLLRKTISGYELLGTWSDR